MAAVRNYSFTLQWEENYDVNEFQKWFSQFWVNSFYYAAAYLVIVFLGRKWMAHRTRYELRVPLICWNLTLAVFSIVGASRTIPEIIHVTRNLGLHHSVCVPSFLEEDKVAGFWTTLFVLSKLPELGDTVFIVLRKQPLIFLHWYHHATVLVYSWYALVEATATARWFVTMNFVVHSAMYSYYALKAMRIRVPVVMSMAITVAQILQMVAGCVVNVLAFQMKRNGQACQVSELNIQLSLLMYFSYFVLFGHFFYKVYCVGNRRTRDDGSSQGPSGKKSQ